MSSQTASIRCSGVASAQSSLSGAASPGRMTRLVTLRWRESSVTPLVYHGRSEPSRKQCARGTRPQRLPDVLGAEPQRVGAAAPRAAPHGPGAQLRDRSQAVQSVLRVHDCCRSNVELGSQRPANTTMARAPAHAIDSRHSPYTRRVPDPPAARDHAATHPDRVHTGTRPR